MQSTPPPRALVLTGALVCDGDAPPAPATVVLEGERVRELVPGRAAPVIPGALALDLTGALLVPGLIDLHTHLLSSGAPDGYEDELLKTSLPLRTLRAAAHARSALDHGFLTMRDVCTEGAGYADVALRDGIRAGLCEGPRVVPSGPGIGITGGYLPMGFAPEVCVPSGCAVVDGADEARREVRRQVSHGVEWIKVFADWSTPDPRTGDWRALPTLTTEELRAVVDEARRRGVSVAAHATSDAGARHAVECGVASIEHMGDLSRATLDAMASAGVTLVPTLSVLERMLRAMPASPRRERLARRVEAQSSAFAMALTTGVTIGLGTDVGCFPHTEGSLYELELMMACGMSPLRALRAATRDAAALLGLGELGRITPGARADLAVFAYQGDAPDLRAVLGARPTVVIQGGRVVRDTRGR